MLANETGFKIAFEFESSPIAWNTLVQNSRNMEQKSHFTASMGEVSDWASIRVSSAELVSETSSVEQANKWAVWANERMDERVAQYLHLDFWLFWPIVSSERTINIC